MRVTDRQTETPPMRMLRSYIAECNKKWVKLVLLLFRLVIRFAAQLMKTNESMLLFKRMGSDTKWLQFWLTVYMCVRGTAWRHCTVSVVDSSPVWSAAQTQRCVDQKLVRLVKQVSARCIRWCDVRSAYATVSSCSPKWNRSQTLYCLMFRPSPSTAAAEYEARSPTNDH